MTDFFKLNPAAFVGYDSILNDLKTFTSTYPPHNIIKVDDKKYVIELAVAGFSEKELSAKLEKNILSISGNHESNNRNYLHKGISNKKFDKAFKLAENTIVDNITISDGILTIELSIVAPENDTTKMLPIGRK